LRICAKLKRIKMDGRMRLMSSITLKKGWMMDATDEPITTTSCTVVKLHGSTFDVRIEAEKKLAV